MQELATSLSLSLLPPQSETGSTGSRDDNDVSPPLGRVTHSQPSYRPTPSPPAWDISREPFLLSELAEVTGELLWRGRKVWQSGALLAFFMLGFIAKQMLMGIALVGKTTGEEVTVKTEAKCGPLTILAPS